MGSDPIIILDAAHTAAASQSLAQGLVDYYPEMRVKAVLGISGDKDPQKLLEPLRDRLDFVVATESGHARGMGADDLADAVQSLGIDSMSVADPKEAFHIAKEKLGAESLLLVFGSVFLVEKIHQLGLINSETND